MCSSLLLLQIFLHADLECQVQGLRFRILGLLHVLVGMSPSPQPTFLFFLPPTPSYHEGLHAHMFALASQYVQALSCPLGPPGACRVCTLVLQSALGRTPVGKKLRQPQGAWSGRQSMDLGCTHPLSLADCSPTQRAQPKEGQMGALRSLQFLLNQPFPKWQWTSVQRDSLGQQMIGISQAQEEGRVHIPPPQGTWSAAYIIQAFKVKVAV